MTPLTQQHQIGRILIGIIMVFVVDNPLIMSSFKEVFTTLLTIPTLFLQYWSQLLEMAFTCSIALIIFISLVTSTSSYTLFECWHTLSVLAGKRLLGSGLSSSLR